MENQLLNRIERFEEKVKQRLDKTDEAIKDLQTK
jgi:hypothetical protein